MLFANHLITATTVSIQIMTLASYNIQLFSFYKVHGH